MHVLVILSESADHAQVIEFASRITEKTGGSKTLLSVGSELDPADQSKQELAAPVFAPDGPLQIRHGNSLSLILAEIQKGDYDLAVIGDGPQAPADDQPQNLALHLAQLCPIPLAIVRSCPNTWDRALICVGKVSPDQNTITRGEAFARELGIEPTILHVIPSPADGRAAPQRIGNIELRYGPVISRIRTEIDTHSYDWVIAGQHTAYPARSEPGLTLANPDLTAQILQLAPPVLVVINRPTETPALSKQAPVPVLATEWGKILRQAAIELLIYAILVTAYAAMAFHFLVDPLKGFYQENLVIYAILAILLIVGQGTLLDALTSFLLDRLRLERFD